MAKPYDAATKALLEADPASWITCAGLPESGPVRLIATDLSTLTADADTIYQVGDPPEYLAHVELQTSHEKFLPGRLLHYNVLVNHRHGLPVRTVAVLFRREADGPDLTGIHQVCLPEGTSYLDFRYQVLRVWTLDVETILRGGVGTLPLAPIANVGESDLPVVIQRIQQRLDAETPKPLADRIWTATKVLMGLKYSAATAERLLSGVFSMRESATYQAIVEEGVAKGRAEGVAKGRAEGRIEGLVEGHVEEAHTLLLDFGTEVLGEPSVAQLRAIKAIVDLPRVRRLIKTLMFEKPSDWDTLLATA